MKSIKIFFLATVAIVAGLFTACSDDDFNVLADPLFYDYNSQYYR